MKQDVQKILDVIAGVCHFDNAAIARVSAFMGNAHELRATDATLLQAQT